jgi:hypothetical protein
MNFALITSRWVLSQPFSMNRTAVGLSRASTSYGSGSKKDVDGRDKPGHDGEGVTFSPEIAIQHAAIDFSQLFQIGNRRAFVDRVHGLADQAEFDHWTIA